MFKRQASALEMIFISTFRKGISRQFFIKLLSLYFFCINFMVACFCEPLDSPITKDCCIKTQSSSLKNLKMLHNIALKYRHSLLFYHYPWKLKLLKVCFYLQHFHNQGLDYHIGSLGRDTVKKTLYRIFRQFPLKRVRQKSCNALLIACGSFISFLLTIIVQRELWARRYFSRLKKNFFDFTPSSYRQHLLLTCFSFVF